MKILAPIRTFVREYALSALFIAVVLVLWEIGHHVFQVADYILPAPSDIFRRIAGSGPLLLGHALVTLREVIGGFLLGASVGISVAVLMAWSRTIERMLYPLVISSQTFPKEALAPLFVVWFGFGLAPKIVIAGLISFFPVVVNTTRGLLSVDPLALDLMRSLSASQRQVFLKLRFPNAVPYLFAALKMCVTLSVIGAVVGEFVGSSAGLGHLVRLANTEMATDLVFAALITLGAMGTLLFVVVDAVEKSALKRWGASMEVRER
ncbi:MAG: ABC transporter permease [Candidatus Latescibacteria bacterium]|nr:ABC transporter permease [Candidatus Latescibacterota bacterium]